MRTGSELQQVTDAAALAAGAAKNVSGSISHQLQQRAAIASNYIINAVAGVSDMELVGTPTVTTGPNTIDIEVKAKVKGSLTNVLNALPRGDALLGNGSGGSLASEMISRDIDLTIHSKVGFTQKAYLCLLALHPTKPEEILFEGNSEFMASCAVQANSNATIAMKTWGSAQAYATTFCSVGGWAGSGFSPNPAGGCSYKSDPFASMALPSAGSCITDAEIPTATTVSSSQGVTVKNTTATLKPGTYCNGLHIKTSPPPRRDAEHPDGRRARSGACARPGRDDGSGASRPYVGGAGGAGFAAVNMANVNGGRVGGSLRCEWPGKPPR